ncbi:MAG TPA: GNAT family N-acetyltransferase, partial [Candidatus Paceibacterota bacterium]
SANQKRAHQNPQESARTQAMTSPSVVRLATPADSQEVWRLLLQAHNENSLFPLAAEKVQWMMNRALYPDIIPLGDTGPRGIIGVIGKEGSLEALVFLLIGQFWYSNDHHLEELLVFTDPEHRKSGHAQAIIQWMKDQVERTGLPLMTGIMSTHRTEAKVRLYSRMLPKVGAFFFLTPKGATLPPCLVAASS